MQWLKMANMALSFVLELAMLAALGHWGYQSGQSPALKILLALGAALPAALIWGFFAAPKASRRLRGPTLALLEIVLLGAGAAALFASGQTRLAWVYLAALVVNRVLWIVWRQE